MAFSTQKSNCLNECFLQKPLAKQPVFVYTERETARHGRLRCFYVQTFGYNRMASKVLKEVF